MYAWCVSMGVYVCRNVCVHIYIHACVWVGMYVVGVCECVPVKTVYAHRCVCVCVCV